MRAMAIIQGSLVAALFASTTPSVFAQTLDVNLVKPYHVLERSLTLLYHHDALVAGRTAEESDGATGGFVESFDGRSYEMLSSVALPHSIRRLKVMDDCRILATSTELFSVINYCSGGRPTVQTKRTPAGMIAHDGTALSGSTFLFTEPNEGMVRVDLSGREKKIAENISYTRSMEFWDGSVWVANYANIYKVDPTTGVSQKAYATDNTVYGFKYTQSYTPEGMPRMVVASARDDKKLVFFNSDSFKPQYEMTMKGEPAGMASFGQCLAVVLSDSKQVYFVRFVEGEPKVVSSWDALPAGDALKQPTEIAVSNDLKTVYLRSSYPCMLCTATQSSVYALYEPTEATYEKCM